ncbi:Hypothetical protein HVR_LOCUS421 [uncultured virus]|nr:Hypothetical protein HVR_LOCUS421 [uncultured virus]
MNIIIKDFETQQPCFDGKALGISKIESLVLNYELKEKDKLLYHGTPFESIPDILMNGFTQKETFFSDLIEQSIYYNLKRQYIGNETEFRLIVTNVDFSSHVQLSDNSYHSKSHPIYNIEIEDSASSRAQLDFTARVQSCSYSQNGKTGNEYRVFSGTRMTPVFLLYLTIAS